MSRERILRLLMLVVGIVMLLAFPAVLMPNDWLAASHRWLGLGEYPSGPLIEYLARSASLLYGFLGALFVLVAGNLRRYAPITHFLGVWFMVLGVVVVGVDLHAGMPLYWTLWEGPPAFAVGLAMVWLNRGIERPEADG
ncbi:MAG: hypothetical protein GY719_15820 [bacterium]|nr:hypothetical protein [bacterium]